MARMALLVTERIKAHKMRDWRENHDALNRMRGEIDDIISEVSKAENIEIPIDIHDKSCDCIMWPSPTD